MSLKQPCRYLRLGAFLTFMSAIYKDFLVQKLANRFVDLALNYFKPVKTD